MQKQARAPQTQPFGADAFAPLDGTVLRWLGMAGFLLNSRGTTLMIDPLLRDFDMPVMIEFPIATEAVPRLDAVLVTHSDNDQKASSPPPTSCSNQLCSTESTRSSRPAPRLTPSTTPSTTLPSHLRPDAATLRPRGSTSSGAQPPLPSPTSTRSLYLATTTSSFQENNQRHRSGQ